MAEVAYLKLTDKKSGTDIKGGCQEKETKELIEVQALQHKVEVPTHRQTGAATGETVHGPLVITKPMDRASPQLQRLLNEHGELAGELHFYRTRDGKRNHWYTIAFEDARLVSLHTHKEMALDMGDRPDLETLEIRYRKITWSHKEANQEAVADWLDK